MYVHLCTYIQLVAYIHTICCIPHSYLHCMLPRVFELALPVLFNPVTVHTMGLSSPLLGNVVVSGPYYHKEAVVTPYIYTSFHIYYCLSAGHIFRSRIARSIARVCGFIILKDIDKLSFM